MSQYTNHKDYYEDLILLELLNVTVQQIPLILHGSPERKNRDLPRTRSTHQNVFSQLRRPEVSGVTFLFSTLLRFSESNLCLTRTSLFSKDGQGGVVTAVGDTLQRCKKEDLVGQVYTNIRDFCYRMTKEKDEVKGFPERRNVTERKRVQQ